LIFVEGLNYALDLSMIKDKPIYLDYPNRLVYSFHLYSFSLPDMNFTDYDQFKKQMDERYGYILEEGQDYTAPLWFGEFGTDISDNYWKFLIKYLDETQIHWAYWAYTGYKHEP